LDPFRDYNYFDKFDETFNKGVPPFFLVKVKLRVINWMVLFRLIDLSNLIKKG